MHAVEAIARYLLQQVRVASQLVTQKKIRELHLRSTKHKVTVTVTVTVALIPLYRLPGQAAVANQTAGQRS